MDPASQVVDPADSRLWAGEKTGMRRVSKELSRTCSRQSSHRRAVHGADKQFTVERERETLVEMASHGAAAWDGAREKTSRRR